MSAQYVSNEKGQITAVQVSIEEWERIKSKYPDVDHLETNIPQWHKDLVDQRLSAIEANPNRILPLSNLLDEIDD